MIGLRPAMYNSAAPTSKSYFVFDSLPDAVVQNQLLVANIGTETGTINLYSVDSTTGMTGGTVYRKRDEERRDVGKWLKLAVSQITLVPGQKRTVNFTITVPHDARAGQHVGGIAAELAIPENPHTLTNNGAQFGVHLNMLTIIAVQVNLPGPLVEDLQATGIQPSGANSFQTVLIRLSNTGNVMLKPSGTLRITNAQGSLRQNLKISIDTFQPGTAIDYPVFVQKQALGPGTYQADLMLTYGHRKFLHYTATFLITSQDINNVFQVGNKPLKAPGEGLSDSVPIWAYMLGGLLLFVGAFFWSLRATRMERRRD